MKAWLYRQFSRAAKALTPSKDQTTQLYEAQARERFLTEKLAEIAEKESVRAAQQSFGAMVEDLVEARAMAGAGPWKVGAAALKETDRVIKGLRESLSDSAVGAYGAIELALNTVDWRREINFSVLQFSRWGIQQIILICRLYYVKNPIVRRLVDVCAAYVFARGVEVTTSDESANEVIKEFLEDNRSVFGQVALVQAERMKDLDGNLFWCLFPDEVNTGKTKARLIDATEINEIVCNPEDSDEEWLFLRTWTQADFNMDTGATANITRNAWYPAMGYSPAEKPEMIRNYSVMWETRTHHRKCGFVGKWSFGCPRVYPMIDWAKEARRFLEACASVLQQLSQIALVLTTKGGQQALMGAKQQLGTTVGPTNTVWDSNPPAVPGAIFASGTGTSLEAFKTQGAGVDPEKVRQYKLMCAMVAGVPETFLGDVSTGNLATATSLDRPTETVFLEKQESWREDLTVIVKFVLQTSAGAANGKLSEAKGMGVKSSIVECARTRGPRGEVVYEAFKKDPTNIQIQVNFPAIREGDMPARVAAIVQAMTLANKAGQVIGIDEKVGVTELYRELGIEDGEEYAEEQYPKGEYEMDRTKEILPAPVMKPLPMPGGRPEIDPKTGQPTDPAPQAPPLVDKKQEASLRRLNRAVVSVLEGLRPDGDD